MSDRRRVVLVRALRGFADGFVSVFLAQYLLGLGYSPLRVGILVTGTLVGSAAMTLLVGLIGHRYGFRTRLLAACAVMLATGIGFLTVEAYVPLLVIAVLGTLNPSAGDVSVFLPTEQAFLASHATGADRTRLYAIYNVGGNVAGALGALLTAAVTGRVGFVVYVAVALASAAVYVGLVDDRPRPEPTARPLEHSRRIVITLAALFSLDSAGGGLVVTSLLVLWLNLKFGLATETTGVVFFALALLSGLSQLLAPRVAARVGLVRTMAFTHLPASAFLVVAALVPNAWLAVGFLMARAALSQMDVPARQAFVMAVVRPEERTAAASVTGVPRSLASATTPAFAGWLLSNGHLAAPLVLAGAVKVSYDLLLLWRFRDVPLDDTVA